MSHDDASCVRGDIHAARRNRMVASAGLRNSSILQPGLYLPIAFQVNPVFRRADLPRAEARAEFLPPVSIQALASN
ncbi:MAG: hypothetical protein U0872_13300 [Planctomycetaceae bacterium]